MSGFTWGLIFILSGLELATTSIDWLWRWRRGLASLLILGWLVGLMVVVADVSHALGLWLFGLLTIYRVVNLMRLVYNRTKELYLRRVVGRTSLWLLAYTVIGVPFYYGWLHGELLLIIMLSAQLSMGLFVGLNTVKNLRLSRLKLPKQYFTGPDLPTVSVAIPARNETTDLVECLQAVLASDYSRLEIIVLDDCSVQATSEVIRSFAQTGVRFVPGDLPHDGWLAKNQAYEVLIHQANGDLILFCGADTRLAPQTISQLVSLYMNQRLKMLTIMPTWLQRRWRATLIQPLRFWWELALPRFAMAQPASLSSCWLADRRWLLDLGGFAAVSRDVRPEKFFARAAQAVDSYQFGISTTELGVASQKQPNDQFATAVRLRYPELHRRPESVLGLSLVVFWLFVMPFLELLAFVVLRQWWLVGITSTAVLLFIISHLLIMRASGQAGWLIGLVNFPLVALTEIGLINLSMVRYEFGTVEWKGRNICLPVMNVSKSNNS